MDTSLLFTVRNGQTQTIMFVRSVPLDFVLTDGQAALWVAVYEPGDARNLSFDPSSPPRPDVPQVHLSLQSIGQRGMAPPRSGDRIGGSLPSSAHALERSSE